MATDTFALFGASFTTGNRGVEALGRSVIEGVAAARPSSRMVVFDHGWGVRPGASVPGLPESYPLEFCGVRQSRRIHRRESWLNVRVSAALGGLGSPVVARLRAARVVFDISGGDSFSEVYGWDRFYSVYQPKAMALRLGTPLALLPQTYGPYHSARARELAAVAIRSAACAWARDEDSFVVLRDIVGDAFDPVRHRCGVDMAFGLQPRQPPRLPLDVQDALESDTPLAGVNVSGLLAYRPPRRLALDYLDAMTELVRSLVDAGAAVILVPHVHSGPESDLVAATTVLERLSGLHASRVLVLPGDLTAHEVKWVISRTDWFCGARMHATIAALSTMTPSIACAYSDKFAGVFASAGMRDAVVDLRTMTADEMLARALASFRNRERSRQVLSGTVPAVVEQARGQMGEIISSIVGSAGQVTT